MDVSGNRQSATVNVELGSRSYQVRIGSGLLAEIGNYGAELKLGSKVLLVSNTTVDPLYGDVVEASLALAGYLVRRVLLPDGEEMKTLEIAQRVYEAAIDFQLDRKGTVVALGGGVIGDLAGFVAATYMRGVPFIQIPTSLLAQVDASVGGKVAVNLPLGKNLVGCFYQPKLVLADVSTLASLPSDEVATGLAEVIKHGVIMDPVYFDMVESGLSQIFARDQQTLISVVAGSIRIKAQVVAQDEEEHSLRAILNFGHTIGHAVETYTQYLRYTHGQAVAIGMAGAMRMACNRGEFADMDRVRVEKVLQQAQLPIHLPADIPVEALIPLLYRDKKVHDGTLRFVLPTGIGTVQIVSDVTAEMVRKALIEMVPGGC